MLKTTNDLKLFTSINVAFYFFNNLRGVMRQSYNDYGHEIGENGDFGEREIKPVDCGGHQIGL